ncbi:hypothetical protein SKAU_G00388370 [Synaphobranchus kaupii]|uniref:Uncharacterized protein n=1 Tax=Synaphobranchus kaupii TaxID=118154 RepID=A0A9Q1EB50_SYNKA|nr:hypothetical protein SKAU_G00388370 [Synaphobranchus kaupii]
MWEGMMEFVTAQRRDRRQHREVRFADAALGRTLIEGSVTKAWPRGVTCTGRAGRAPGPPPSALRNSLKTTLHSLFGVPFSPKYPFPGGG